MDNEIGKNHRENQTDGPMTGTLDQALAIDMSLIKNSPEFFSGPAWDNSSEYPGIESEQFKFDFAEVHRIIDRLSQMSDSIQPSMQKVLSTGTTAGLEFGELAGLVSTLQGISILTESSQVILHNLISFASCEGDTDSKNMAVEKIKSQLMAFAAKFSAVVKPTSLFLQKAPGDLVESYLQHPQTQAERFDISESRKVADLLLSDREETLISTLAPNGILSWSRLYSQISGNLICKIKKDDGTINEVGLSQAAGMIRDADESVRRPAWKAIQKSWKEQEIPCAAVLNSLAGWRLDLYQRRSQTRKLDFLDQPLHDSRISRATLEAMLSVVHANIETPRRALRTIAKKLGKEKLDPWDLIAPAPAPTAAHGLAPGKEPESKSALTTSLSPNALDNRFHLQEESPKRHSDRRTFMQAVSLIRDAFSAVDPSFGAFVDVMERNHWIEGRVLPNKRQGAYCTGFPKSRTPRVFQTYMGSISDLRTLAHELGHAYHSWVMRDMPRQECEYPMTLAETASIFAETAFADHMLTNGSARDRYEISWQNAETAAAFLINIPARFEFECNFYEARKAGSLSAHELSEMTDKAWRNWYGDTITTTERQYWQTKLHFSIGGVSFYNFPYTFGYLFSLGIYAMRAKLGDAFHPAYIAILRDTGRMTAEDLVKKHLGADITRPEFWQSSLDIVATQLSGFN